MSRGSLGEAVILITADGTQFEAQVKQTSEKAIASAGDSMKNLGGKMEGVGKTLSLSVTAPLALIGTQATKTAADFEQSMALLRVNTGASGEAMAKMSALAKQLGADTVFSAGEAADAMLELAKGGFTEAQITGGGVQAVMAMAAAEGLNLADAATITSNAMNAFGIQASEASRIADVLAAGSAASSASIESLAQGLANVGPVAASAGLSLEDTTTALALFDANAIKGAEGGTALRSFLTALTPTSNEAKKAIEELGLEFTNADGSFKSLADISQQLQDKMGGMAEAERAATMQTIFGTYAKNAANVLLKEGAAGWEEMSKQVTTAGKAEELANARMEGTNGALERMSGSLETAGLAIGEALAPHVVAMADRVGNLADKFTQLSPGMQSFIVGAGAAAAALGPMLIVTGKTITAVGQISSGLGAASAAFTKWGGMAKIAGMVGSGLGSMVNVMGSVGKAVALASKAVWGFTASLLANPITWVVIGLVALGAALYVAYQKSETFRNIVDAVGRAIRDGLGAALEWLKGLWEKVQPALAQGWEAIKASWDNAKAGASALWNGIKAAFEKIQQSWETAKAGAALLWRGIQVAFDMIKAVVSKAISVVSAPIQGLVQMLTGAWQIIKGIFTGNWDSIVEGFGNMIGGLITFVIGLPMRLIQAIAPFAQMFWTWITGLWTTANTYFLAGVDAVVGFFAALPGRIWAFITQLATDIGTWAVNLWETVKTNFMSGIDATVAFVQALPGRVMAFAYELLYQIGAWAVGLWETVKANFLSGIDATVAFVQQLPGKVINAVVALYSQIVQWANEVWDKAKTAFTEGVEKVRQTVTELPGKITGALSGLPGQLRSLGGDIVQGLINGISDRIKDVATKAAELGRAAWEAAKAAVGAKSPARKFIELGDNIGEGLTIGINKMQSDVAAAAKNMASSTLTAFGSPTIGFTGSVSRPSNSLSSPGILRTSGNQTNVYNITISVDDLDKMSKVSDFVAMLDGARNNYRRGVGSMAMGV